ncbi:MAG TPA: acyltransferase [Chloroflexota bacterium]|nr:acyltransferase [Chloroflexota bacterium]
MAIAELVRTALADDAPPRRVAPPPPAAPGPAPTERTARAQRKGRLEYLDSLKVALTALVIAHHAGQSYGPTGGSWPIFDAERAAVLGPFFAVNAAFFMGLFFMISAYFLPASLDRKGAVTFLRDRVVRLGVPLAVLALALFAPMAYLSYAEEGGTLGFLPFLAQVYVGQWQVEFGHLWFVSHLLVYSVAYVAWRLITRGRAVATAVTQDSPPPSTGAIFGFTLALAALSFVVRIQFPVDRWVDLFGFLPAEPAHLPQYAALFGAGIVAYRNRWLERLPTTTGLTWLGIGLGAAVLRYAYPLAANVLGPDTVPALARGGLNRGSLLWSTWEAVICAGLCIGLVVLFRQYATTPGRLMRAAAPNAYGAYILHILPVVGLQFALAGVALPPLAKFALVTAFGLPLSFLITAGLRRLPGVRSVL